jgi:hypothetical protein
LAIESLGEKIAKANGHYAYQVTLVMRIILFATHSIETVASARRIVAKPRFSSCLLDMIRSKLRRSMSEVNPSGVDRCVAGLLGVARAKKT